MAANQLEFRALGPLEVTRDGLSLDLGPVRQQALLGVFLSRPNETLTADTLLHAVWGDDPPNSGTRVVPTYVYRLRQCLGPDVSALTAIERARGGYQLRVSWDLLDTERFERRIAEGHQARRAGDEQLARRLLASGLSYWRGVPFGSLPGPALAVRREYLTEYRLVALEDRIELDLRYGDPAAIVPEIRLLRAGYPARERFTAHLMYALWRCGRQAEAVDAYGETRRRLVRDLGVEPGTALRDLYCKILRDEGWNAPLR
ncbi:hypothetical protein GCM10009765_02490 [Fodinicola feengrottensis]|uniref:OmpR/PhoB-type domain-containing protein n=1 Tax=Fodinicola feengrottensis TaxID=435914 RepID=A0ABP4RPJ4_9ACTN